MVAPPINRPTRRAGFMPEVLTRGPEPMMPPPAAAPASSGFQWPGGGMTMDPAMQGGLLALAGNLLQARDRGQGLGGALGSGLLDMQRMQQFLKNQELETKDREQRRLYYESRAQQEQRENDQAAKKAEMLEGEIAKLPPDQQSVARADPDAYFKGRAEQMFAAPKPPQTRTINDGGTEVTQEWDGSGWQTIASGSRWAPQQPGQQPLQLVQVQRPDGTVAYVPEQEAIGMSPPGRGSGMQIETNPDGTMRLVMGGGSTDPVTAREGVSKTRAADLTFKTADDALAKLAERVKDKGMSVLPGAEQQESATVYRLAINELRKLTESGALQKADLDYLQSIIQDPTAMSAAPQAVGNLLGTGSTTTGTQAQIQAARDYLSQVRARTGEVYTPQPAEPNGQAGDAEPPTVTPEDAAKLALGTKFRTQDGRVMVRQ